MTQSTTVNRSQKSRALKRFAKALPFILPNFLGFFIFELIPIFASFVLSLCEWDSSNPIKFVGLANFAKMFSDQTFKISFWNTLYYVAGNVPLTIACSLGLALLLNQKMKGTNFFRTAFFTPYITSLIAVAIVWNMMYHPTMGPINQFLQSLGFANPPGWTTSVKWAMPSVIITSVWRGMGYYMILFLAGLQAIPGEAYEAAAMDGANGWQRFWSITLPMLAPTTFFVTIMLTISSFKVFDLILAMTKGGPGRATNVLVYYIYQKGFSQFQFGYASAISMILFIVVLVITIVQMGLEKKWVQY